MERRDSLRLVPRRGNMVSSRQISCRPPAISPCRLGYWKGNRIAKTTIANSDGGMAHPFRWRSFLPLSLSACRRPTDPDFPIPRSPPLKTLAHRRGIDRHPATVADDGMTRRSTRADRRNPSPMCRRSSLPRPSRRFRTARPPRAQADAPASAATAQVSTPQAAQAAASDAQAQSAAAAAPADAAVPTANRGRHDPGVPTIRSM